MENWREMLSAVGPVVTFDYPYRNEGRRLPDRLPVLLEAHREALESGRRKHGDSVWLVGKSMGSRVGCHLANTEACEGVICFGYPLVSQSGAHRTEALVRCRAPLLLIQGTRDRLAPLDEIRSAIQARLLAPTRLVIVPSGDHSLELTRGHLRAIGKSQAEVDRELLAEIRGFMGTAARDLHAEAKVAVARQILDTSLAERPK